MKAGWEAKTLGDVCDKASSNVSQNQLNNEVGEYPIFGASGLIKNVSFYHRDKPYLSIVKDGSGVGRVTKMEAFTSVIGTLQYILPNEEVDLDYLNYSLMSVDFKKYVAGAAIPHIYFKDYKNEPFLWMPLPEQQRIVAILDQAFEGIAKARANAEQNLQNARALFESHLQSVFTQRGESWVLRPLSEISKVVSGYSFKSSDFSSSNQIKTIKITNVGVKEFVDDFDSLLPSSYQNKYEAFTVKSGSIVIALTRTIIQSGLKVAIVPSEYDGALLNQRVAAITTNSEYALDSFLYLYLSTKQVEEYVTSHVNTLMQPNLSVNDLKALPIPLPIIAEQSKMVVAVETLSKETQRLEALYQRKIACLDELKKSLLQQAFSGEL